MAAPATALDLLRDLVAIPSVNPQGDPGTDSVGEQALGEYVASFLRELGAETSLEEVEPGRPNVRATFAPEGGEIAHLAFAPHLDTVSVAGMTVAPFDPVVRDGKLFGRGSSDTKGPMAAALWALREWAQSAARAQSRVRWTFHALMGEEAGNDGAHALVKSGFASDLTLVLEPTQLGVVTAHKGALWLEVTTRGVACHGATPERGVSAIYAMRHVLTAIEEVVIPQLARHAHPKLGPTTLNTGTIAGGSKINIVPDFCRIELDCRYVPGLTAEQLRAEVEQLLRSAGAEVDVRIQRTSTPLEADEKAPWLQRLGAEAKGFTTAPWFSDASVLASSGRCPAVCVGPGSIAQAHTKDEFILVDDYAAGVDFFGRWLRGAEEAARHAG
jgi:acetylornithine deacetylase/succinyl-diaminopimelate desuccinylase family protein